jgi:7,8-dihydroneopterin aldolase/epimerase/oxygenase
VRASGELGLVQLERLMDRVFVRGLVGMTIVGVHDWEQKTPRKVVLNLEFSTDVKAVAASDDIKNAVSYSAVSRRLLEFLSTSKTFLVETLAERLADIILQEFPVTWLRLELHKPAAFPEADTVGVIIERGTQAVTS